MLLGEPDPEGGTQIMAQVLQWGYVSPFALPLTPMVSCPLFQALENNHA